MAAIPFTKYHGCGNDFIIIQDLDGQYNKLLQDPELVKRMCDRNFGIGADELLQITSHNKYDFEMVNYSGRRGIRSDLCGNGSRCAISFSRENGIFNKDRGTFLSACDGPHDFCIDGDKTSVSIQDVLKNNIGRYGEDFYLDLGSKHYVRFVADVGNYDVMTEGQEIRNRYNVNVNFAEVKSKNEVRLRTYERDTTNPLTKACGTGSTSTAVALAVVEGSKPGDKHRKTVVNPGGTLIITFTDNGDRFSDITLTGPAEYVFSGTYRVPSSTTQ